MLDEARRRWNQADEDFQQHKEKVRRRVQYDEALAASDKARDYYDRLRQRYEDAHGERRLRLADRIWRDLKGREFEEYVREILDCLGFVTRLTAASGDQGIDVIATKNGVCWESNVRDTRRALEMAPFRKQSPERSFITVTDV